VVNSPNTTEVGGPYRVSGQHNDRAVYENAKGARLRFETIDNPKDWAANKWLQHDCWVIRYAANDLYAAFHDGSSLPVGKHKGKHVEWKSRSGSKLPIRVCKRRSDGQSPTSAAAKSPKPSTSPTNSPSKRPAAGKSSDFGHLRSSEDACYAGDQNAQRQLGGGTPVPKPSPIRFDPSGEDGLMEGSLGSDVIKIQDGFASPPNDDFFQNPILSHHIDCANPAKDIRILSQTVAFLSELSDREILRRVPLQVPVIHNHCPNCRKGVTDRHHRMDSEQPFPFGRQMLQEHPFDEEIYTATGHRTCVWDPRSPDVYTCPACKEIFPNRNFPMDKKESFLTQLGEEVEVRWYEDPAGINYRDKNDASAYARRYYLEGVLDTEKHHWMVTTYYLPLTTYY